jgi:hypothetical protein
MELNSYWNGFLKLFLINLFFQRTSQPTSKSNNTILKLRTKQESRAHGLCEHSQLLKKTMRRAFRWHLQAFTIIEARQDTAYLTPKRHAFHLPNPIILCKCKVCYSLVAYWKLATLIGSNRLVHILSNIGVLSSSFSSPCTLFDARFNLFSTGRIAPRGSDPDPYKQ